MFKKLNRNTALHLKHILFSTGCFLLCLMATSSYAAETQCAVVKIEIAQELTFERQGFEAIMRINNGLEDIPLTDVKIDVHFYDANGKEVAATATSDNGDEAFFIRVDQEFDMGDGLRYYSKLNHFVEGETGSAFDGRVEGKTTGEVRWLIIPTGNAIPDSLSAENRDKGVLYYVGATITYNKGVGGEQETVEVAPDFITVKPQPELYIDYFIQDQVFGDDPK